MCVGSGTETAVYLYRSASEFHLSPMPFHRFLQALFEIHQRPVSEMLLSLRDVGQGMLHIPGSFRSVLHLALVAGDLLQHIEGFVKIDPMSRGNVENLPHRLRWRLACQQVRADRV